MAERIQERELVPESEDGEVRCGEPQVLAANQEWIQSFPLFANIPGSESADNRLSMWEL